jgi:preprotein translocase subunit SecE
MRDADVSQTTTNDAGGRRRGGDSRASRVGVALYLRQVIAELRKVVRPTRNELITYTIAALIFVSVVMAFVFLLDLVFGKLVLWVFAG